MKKILRISLAIFPLFLLLTGCSTLGKKQDLGNNMTAKVTSIRYDDGDVRVKVHIDSSKTSAPAVLLGTQMTLKDDKGIPISYKTMEFGKGADDVSSDSDDDEKEIVMVADKGEFTVIFGSEENKSNKYEFSLKSKDKTLHWNN